MLNVHRTEPCLSRELNPHRGPHKSSGIVMSLGQITDQSALCVVLRHDMSRTMNIHRKEQSRVHSIWRKAFCGFVCVCDCVKCVCVCVLGVL